MKANPVGWHAIIVGAWNTAILTPDGIRRRLFELPDDASVEIEVAIDRPGPYRVRHDGITIVPGPSSLEVAPREQTVESIADACTLLRKALNALPETPVTAAGVNFRYSVSENSDDLIDLLDTNLDGKLSDHNFSIKRRSTRRSLTLDNGVLNIDISTNEDQSGSVLFNFHCESSDPQTLDAWLDNTELFYSEVNKVMSILSMDQEDN